MKILKVSASGFKKCVDNLSISFVPKANKTQEDKEFELNKIDDELYVFSTIGIIGKNASGKTTTVKLLALVYEIFSFFRVTHTEGIFINNRDIFLDVTFYHEGYLYRYLTNLSLFNGSIVIFNNESLYKRKYYKTYASNLFNYEKYEKINIEKNLPEDISIIYELIKKIDIRGNFYSSVDDSYNSYAFDIYKNMENGEKIIETILKMFDEHLDTISIIDKDKYQVKYVNKEIVEVTSRELYNMLSSGTTKGFNLFTMVVYSLKHGSDLLIDEIENHFHRTLVENLITLYRDKSINKLGASLIFTTHYPELLDLFNRSDYIYI